MEIENTPKILFDTGANRRILLSNIEKLKIDPASIDEVFISHLHFDHTGGLSEFELFRDLELICPTHCTQHKAELKKLYPQKYIEGGAGQIIEI